MEENRDKVLYIRLPHTIKNMDEIRDLLVGDVQIKLPRQSSRHCHVIFSTVEEKMKNFKELKKKRINNKRIIVNQPKINLEKKIKTVEKKTVVPNPKPELKISSILYVTNINQKTMLKDIKKAFVNCKSATFLDNPGKSVKKAIVKLSDSKLSAEYLKKKRPWPIIDGNKLIIKPDTRKQKKKKPGLKIWDGEVEIKINRNIESNNTQIDGKQKEDKKEMKVERNKKEKIVNVSVSTAANDE